MFDETLEYVVPMMDKDAENVHQMVMTSNAMNINGSAPFKNMIIPLEVSGRPHDLLCVCV
jgi:hypothetical protein